MHSDSYATPEPFWRDPLLIAAGAVACAWLVTALSWPLSGDASVFAWMADTTLRGGRPYVDAWDTKGPGAWLPALVLQVITGRNTWSVRVFDAVMLLVALVSMRSITAHMRLRGAGRVAMALYVTWYCGLDYWNGAQPDGWVGVWLIAACALALRGGIAAQLGAGALVALCTLVKPFYIGFAAVIWLLAAGHPGLTTRGRTRAVVATSVGMSLALIGAMGLLHAAGGLEGYREVQQWNRDIYAQLDAPWLTRIPATLRGAVGLPWGLVAPLALFGVLAVPRGQRIVMWALALGWLGAVAGVFLQGKLWLYHWLPMLPFYAVLADAGLTHLTSDPAQPVMRRFGKLMGVVALIVAALSPLQHVTRYAMSRASAERVATYERREFDYYRRGAGSLYAIMDSLAAIEPGTARVLVWTMHLAPSWLHGLQTPTEYAVIRPLYDGDGSAYRSRFRARFLDEVTTAPPRWWILPTVDVQRRAAVTADQSIDKFPDADRVLRERYHRAAQTGDWVVYELNAPAAAAK